MNLLYENRNLLSLMFRKRDIFVVILFISVLAGISTSFRVAFAQTGEAEKTVPAFQFGPALTQAARMPRLRSILVSFQRHVVLEEYFNGSSARDVANIKSVSKSVISALVGIAIEQGYINGVNQPIDEFFNDLLTDQPDKAEITIGNLLSMESGLETTSNRNYGAWVLSSDWVHFALNQPLLSSPGMHMHYSTGNTHLLSAILTSATGMSTLAFARNVLADPLGFRLAPWPTDPKGIYFGGNDMEMTARQMLAFGELYLNAGRKNGKQIVPADWVEVSLQRHARSTREHGRYYGYGWWLRDMAGHDAAYAWGYGGQFIILVPELELVVVTTSASTPDSTRRGHRREVQNLVEQHIIQPVAGVVQSIQSGLATALSN